MMMTQEKPRTEGREFGLDDARALACGIIESEAGAQYQWTAGAVDTLAAIILWEACKTQDRAGARSTVS